MMSELLANTNKQNLKEHLLAVGLLSRHYATTHFPCLGENYRDAVLLAGLLHDIGKATGSFQSFLESKLKDSELMEESGKKFSFHNEDGYFFATSYLKKNVNPSNLVAWLVYHHHAPRATVGKIKETSEIRKALSKKDHKAIESVMKEMLTFYNELKEGVSEASFSSGRSGEDVPSLVHYLRNKNKELNGIARILQSCLVTADRKISTLSCDELSAWLESGAKDFSIFKLDSKENTFKNPEVYSDRDRTQNELAMKCTEGNNFTVLKAPPGFGKSRTAMRWLSFSHNNGPIFFVTPRNTIAESIYLDLKNELSALGIEKTIELYLTGEVKAQTGLNAPFTSDIVVTNIDSILSPFISHGKLDWLINIYTSTMIVDEFHEFTSRAPMFCLIGDLLRARMKCGSPTLLMSATPIKGLDKTWFSENSLNSVSFEPPIFDNDIHIKLTDSVLEARDFLANEGCYIANTVGNCQAMALTDLGADVIHGVFSQKDKTDKLSQLLIVHGKELHKANSQRTLCASGIVQASLNISFPAIMDSICSPEATVQRIGRLGRFDNSPCKLAILSKRDRGDIKMIEEAYSLQISDAWLTAIETFLGDKRESTVSRSAFLNFYGNFCEQNEALYNEWIERLQEDSLEAVNSFGMYNKSSKNEKLGPMRIGMNLRGGEGYFVLVEQTASERDSNSNGVLLSTTANNLRNLIENGYRVESKRVNDYIEQNRKVLKESGFNYKSKSYLSKMGESAHTNASKSADQPLLCNKNVWGATYAVYDSRLGLITRKAILERISADSNGGNEADFIEE